MKTDHTIPWGSRIPDVTANFTNQNQMYFKYLYMIKRKFPLRSVIEVGPGDGTFAMLMSDEYSLKKYTLLDLERNLHFSRNRMEKHFPKLELECVAAKNFNAVFDEKYDLFVSNCCIDETPVEYRRHLLNNILPNCKSSMIIVQLQETNDTYKEDFSGWITSLYTTTFDNHRFELTPYKNCYALLGWNNE